MKVIYDNLQTPVRWHRPYLAIGVFDGLHLGHQTIIRRMIRNARRAHAPAMVMTFYPHPLHIVRPQADIPLIVSLSHRLRLIEELGADACLVIRFNKRFAGQPPERFINRYLLGWVRPRCIYVGYDFRFGRNRQGDTLFLRDYLRSHSIRVNIVRPVKRAGHVISSTRIRQLIAAGRLSKAALLLGRPVSVIGRVIRGDRRGKQLGFPTANIVPREEIIPPDGVYLVKVRVQGQSYHGVANVGTRPSFDRAKHPIQIEAHIFGFQRNIYGQMMEVSFLRKIRPERVFPTKSRLVRQIQADIRKAKRVLQSRR